MSAPGQSHARKPPGLIIKDIQMPLIAWLYNPGRRIQKLLHIQETSHILNIQRIARNAPRLHRKRPAQAFQPLRVL